MKAIAEFIRASREKPVLLVIHSRADADAVSSAAALSEYFHGAKICVPDSISASGRRISEKFKVEVAKFAELKFHPELVIVLDTNSYALLPGMQGYIEKLKGKVGVIDHHSPHMDAVKAGSVFVDTRASSTAEILYELFRELNFPISSRVAELMLAGIVADSADLKTATTRTLEVVAYLLKRTPISLAQVFEMTEGVPDASYRIAVLKALSRTRVSRAGDFIFAVSEVSTHEAVSAERLVALGADYAFVAQATHGELRISARCRSALVSAYGANVAEIMGEVGKLVGGTGGGHPSAAGANGPEVGKLGDALALAEALARSQIKKAALARVEGRI